MKEYEFLMSSFSPPGNTKMKGVIDKFINSAILAITSKMHGETGQQGYFSQLGFGTIRGFVEESQGQDQAQLIDLVIRNFPGQSGEGFIRLCLLEFSRMLASESVKTLNGYPADFILIAKEYLSWKNQEFDSFVQANNIEVIKSEQDINKMPKQEEWDQLDRDVNFDLYSHDSNS